MNILSIIKIKFLILFIFISIGIVFCESKVDSKSNDQAIEYAKKVLKKNEKYFLKKNDKNMKSLIVGFWTHNPIASYEFKKNGDLTIWYVDDFYQGMKVENRKIIKGKWSLKDNKLVLKLLNRKKEYKYSINIL